MMDVVAFTETFMATFDKSAVELFRRWLAAHPHATKWVIGADFALRDNSRPGDCFAFAIMPFDVHFTEHAARVEANLPRDLKDSRSLSSESAAWLRDPQAFHIVVPINRDRKVYAAPGLSAVDVARESLGATLRQMIELERGETFIGPFRKAVQKARANSFNVGLFTDLTLLSLLLPIMTVLIARERRSEVIGWFCDRDSMTSWCDGLAWNLARENLRGLQQKLGIERECGEPVIAVPDRSSGTETMWFDHYIRNADWLAGTLAAWDRANNDLPSEKYVRVVEDVIADSENAVFMPVTIRDSGFEISRLLVDRVESVLADGESSADDR
jgi:hypothetical protein